MKKTRHSIINKMVRNNLTDYYDITDEILIKHIIELLELSNKGDKKWKTIKKIDKRLLIN